MKKLCAILFIFLMTVYTLSPAHKKIQFSHISIEQGLSQSTVSSIYQDATGFMWFGTVDGLNRYDGNNIRIYQANPNDPYSLSNNTIWTIIGDTSGFLWIATDKGLNKFDPRKEKFNCYENNPGDPNSLSDNRVRDIFVDSSGFLWIGTSGKGLTKFDPKTERFTMYAGPPEQPFNKVDSICEDKSGFLWIGSNFLYKFNPKDETYRIYRDFKDESISASGTARSLFFDDKAGILWVGTFAGGLYKFDPQKETFTNYSYNPKDPYSLNDNNIRVVCKDQTNTLWLGTFAGLSRFDIRREEFFNYKYDPSDPHSMSNDNILSIFEDRSGAIWIGVRGGGLNVFDRKLNKFLFYQHDPNNPHSLSDNDVWGFAEDESGLVWIATENGGLNKFDPENETFAHYRHDATDPDTIISDNVFTLCRSYTGKLWVGTALGLEEFDPVTGKTIHYSGGFQDTSHSPNTLLHIFILSILEDRSGIVWIGTQFGLDRFNPRKKEFTHHLPDPDSTFSPKNDIRTIYEDTSGVIWIGTRGGGVYKFNRETEKFTMFDEETYSAKGLNYPISTIIEDQFGLLWIGTKGGGIHELDRSRKKMTVYTRMEGLPNNIVHGILEDNQGNLWISTTKGLSRYTRSTKTFRNYSQKSGLQSYEFHSGSFYKSRNGEMYFGGAKGFNRFFPGKVVDNMFIPPIVITSFKITDKSEDNNGDLPLQKEIPFEDKVELSYKDNIFSIEFAALDYTAPEKNQYKCMLEGFNNDWINLGHKNDITFTNLDPGKYTFKVMGSNNDGYWNAEGASLKIIISPPFWQTWYFRAYMLLLFFGFLFMLHKIRTTRIKQNLEKKRLEEEIRLKADFTAMLVHDLRSPLTAIIGYSDMLDEMPDQMDVKKTGQVIHRSSEKMLSLINDMLELSKFEAGKMSLEKKEVDIVSTVMEIVEIITPLFKKRDIELICDFKPVAKETKLNIDVDKIGQVITNFLSNAAKFTPRNGKVLIRALKTMGDFMLVSVSDNGPGVPRDKQDFLFDKYFQFNRPIKTKGTGLGLAVSKMIIESHGGIIGYEPAKDGRGSTFYFKLPVTANKKID